MPSDNPFLGANTARCGLTGRTSPGNWCQETFAWGLRNPFRFNMDPNAADTRFFINDTGQDHWEEIDLGQPGADYGWNVREGHCAVASSVNCDPPPLGMTNPIYDYDHSAGCNAITGGAFVPDGLWPSQYDGAYLFQDFICGKVFQLMPDGAGGFTASEFATDFGLPIDMAFGPHGSSQALYYLQCDPPALRRIVFSGSSNRSPRASIQASPTHGPLPLQVDFHGEQSSDPDNHPLTFQWDFGDGASATGASPSHEYQTAGTYTATLTVFDGQGGQDSAEIRIDAGNNAPIPSIASPIENQLFSVGETITLSGSATDPEDFTVPSSSLSWQVVKHHAAHTHPFLAPTPGSDTTITTPIPEDFGATTNSYLEVRLTATDSQGLSTTVSRELRPRLVNLNFATNPAGLGIDLNGAVAPASITSWDGWTLQLSTAKTQFTSSGQGQNFVSWSDDGAPSHAITTPATDRTYTATFTPNYVRPRGAQKTRVPLIPAHRRCTAPNTTHGAPLSHPSCTPTAPTSGYATVGTPDANGSSARSIGYVQFRSRLGNDGTPADEADVEITASISDVFRAGSVPTDYVGDLRMRARLQMTDKLNGSAVVDPATVNDFFLNVPMPCTPTADLSGSRCEAHTTADALFPGFVVESRRTLWELGAVQVFDGGVDGSTATLGDTLFATQGLFVP